MGRGARAYVVQGDDRVVVVVTGEIDSDVARDLARVLDKVRRTGLPVDLDMGGVTFLDSTGVQFLLRARRDLPGSSRLVRPSRAVRAVLALMGMERLFEVVDEAVARPTVTPLAG